MMLLATIKENLLRNKLSFIFVIVISIFISGCKPNNISFEELKLDSFCFPFDFYTDVPQFKRDKGELFIEEELIINDEKEYQNLLKYRRGSKNLCLNVSLPEIDFSKKTLLGKFAQGNCATVSFDRKVIKNDVQKTIIYQVSDKNANFACSGPGLNDMNLITVSKIPQDYKIIFKPKLNRDGYKYYEPANGTWVIRNWYGKIIGRQNMTEVININ